MDNKQARYLHRMLDRLAEGKGLSPEEITLLRESLPELPTQKTLEEIAWDIHFAWCETVGNDWKEEMFGDLEAWLSEQHNQLRAHLEGVKSQAHPEFLETEDDYANAPKGTVVAQTGQLVWVKDEANDWTYSVGTLGDYSMSKSGPHRVLRWGWGE